MIHFMNTKQAKLFKRVDAMLTKAHEEEAWDIYDLLWNNFYAS